MEFEAYKPLSRTTYLDLIPYTLGDDNNKSIDNLYDTSLLILLPYVT